MSRVAKKPISVSGQIEVNVDGQHVSVKGAKGSLSHQVNALVTVSFVDNVLAVAANEDSQQALAQAGTARAILANLVHGVSVGFEKKLELVGVGYRAQAQGSVLNLNLGFSHPIAYQLPEGITAETPTQTEILIKGIDKQKVGQVAAEVRAFRPPEPYKGKGVRYSGERVVIKETKKK